ncbi:MAG: hypothetical protein L3K15_07110 [Thermoplasmata archaeon]|nr:hypothetical protein [Thermoplasmata archaeon]
MAIVAVAYVAAIGILVPHHGLAKQVGWSIPRFDGSWQLTEQNTSDAYLTRSGVAITVGASTPVVPGVSAGAFDSNLPTFNLTRYPFLSVDVSSSSVYLAVQIILGEFAGESTTIVLSTFADANVHTIYVNLGTFGFSGLMQFSSLTLGWRGVQSVVTPTAEVQFQNLSLLTFTGG